MSTVVTRRSSERKKTQKAASKEKEVQPIQSWANEALAVWCFAIALILLVSLLSHELMRIDTARLGLSGKALASRNAMGPMGHFIGTLLSGFMGWAALVPIVFLTWLAYHFWYLDDEQPLLQVDSIWVRLLGLAGFVFFSATAGAVFWESRGGGSLGILLAQPLSRLFGTLGAGFIALALLVLSLAITTRVSVGIILGAVWNGLKSVLTLCFITIPVIAVRVLSNVSGLTFSGVGRLSTLILKPATTMFGRPQETPSEDELPIPKPRLRKNAIRTGEGEEEDSPASAEPQPEPEVVRAVVRRRTTPKPESSKARDTQKDVDSASEDENPFKDYAPPGLDVLTRGEHNPQSENDEELLQISKQIETKLKDFDVQGRITQVHPGPVVTLFEFEPAAGVKVGRIAALQDDIAMHLRASSVRIIAPIPKRGTVGIEVPNRHRDLVRLRDILESDAWQQADSPLSVPLGKDVYGDPVVVDIATMPHLLMAGATGTGKSVSINAVLCSLLYRNSPADVGFILIDPKILELSVYEGIPHLRVPVVTTARQAKAVLEWAVSEMHRRYRLMQRFGVRGIDSYNKVVRGEVEPDRKPQRLAENVVMLREEEVIQSGTIDKTESIDPKLDDQLPIEQLKPLPKIIIVVDELADLMLSVGREIEELITRLAQKARAAGIHLVIATQRPSVDVITGLIKANFPARVSFRVASRVDSRTILDQMGADKLLGKGDMLVMLAGAEGLRRVHGAFVSDTEVKKVVQAARESCSPQYDQRIIAICQKALEEEQNKGEDGEPGSSPDEYDEFYDQAVDLVLQKGQASTSMLQRAFRIGYNRAARIIEVMEKEGVVGPMDGAKPREVLAPPRQAQETEEAF